MQRTMIARTPSGKRAFILAILISFVTVALIGLPAATPAKPPVLEPAVSHKVKQTPPIKLGTSGGGANDIANGYCCGGTLGSLVEINGARYILSNWHVFNGGNTIIQPGLIDVQCNDSLAQVVAGPALNTPSPQESNVDAAIAAAVPGMVSPTGEILEIGPPADTTVAAYLGQYVKKSGRTSGLTHSKVSGLNATISVSYSTECAGPTVFTKTYTGQILVARGGKFLKAGDSGSLMVEEVATNPRAVGLLFAGSNLIAVANPIGEVLATIGARMVGGAATAGVEATAGLEAAIGRARAAQMRNADILERLPDSNGHAIGLDRSGRVVIKVLLESDSPRARAEAPRSLDGIPVVVEVVGKIVAY